MRFLADTSFAIDLIHGFTVHEVIINTGGLVAKMSPRAYLNFKLAATLLVADPAAYLLRHVVERPSTAVGRNRGPHFKGRAMNA